MALVIFFIVKSMNKLAAKAKKKEAEDAKEAKKEETPEDIKLLREIRDSLKGSKKEAKK